MNSRDPAVPLVSVIVPVHNGEKYLGEALRSVLAYVPSALMVRKEVFDRVGVFDTTYLSGEDTEWFSRATHHEIGMTILPRVLVHRRIHSSNVSALALERRAGQLLRIVKASIDRKKGRSGDGGK